MTDFDLVPVPIFIVSEGVLTYLNKSAKEIAPFAESLIGQPTKQYWADLEEHTKFWNQLQRDSYIHNFRALFQFENQRIFPASISARIKSKGVVVASYLDLSAQVKAETELKQHLQQTERANRSLSDFSRVVSHELKAPLRRILGFSQVLKEECLQHDVEGSVKEALTYIDEGVHQMDSVIDTLRRFAHIDAHPLKITSVCLYKALEQAQEILGCVVTLETEMPVVEGEETLLRQVFVNLLDNGYKFNKSLTPEIRIRAIKKPQYWLIEVQDNGSGIEPQYLSRVFEMFERFHPRQKGDGVGLALSRKIIEAHGGEIGVRTKHGLGSVFWFTIPSDEHF